MGEPQGFVMKASASLVTYS